MEDRFRKLEGRLETLAESLAAAEHRLERIETALARGGPIVSPRPAPAPEAAAPPASSGIDFSLSDLGRAFLVMAGAFALRALTDLAVLPRVAGIALGLAYALLWLLMSDRAAAADRRVRATTNGTLAALIAFPLIWEASTKFDILAPAAAALLLAAYLGLGLASAWRRRLRPLAWLFALGAAATATALPFATGSLEPYIAVLLICGLATVWLAYGRKWLGMRWPIAALADFMVVFMVSVAAGGHSGSGRYGDLSPGAVQALAVALLVGYLGSFAVRTLWRRRDVTVFEVLQSAAALAAGFGGAVRIAQVTQSKGVWLGVAALIAAALCYLVAFAFVHRRSGRGRNFIFYTSLGLVLTFTGSGLLAGGGALAAAWCLLALAMAYLGGRNDRITLRTHAAVYTIAAAWQAGLLRAGWSAFTAPALEIDASPPRGVLLMLIAGLLVYAILVLTQRRTRARELERLPRFAVLVAVVIGASGLLIGLAVQAAAARGAGAVTSALTARVLILSAATIGLAAGSRRPLLSELGWLVYPLLALGGALLVFGGLRNANALTLTVSFLAYGAALIAAPRLLRGPAGDGAAEAAG